MSKQFDLSRYGGQSDASTSGKDVLLQVPGGIGLRVYNEFGGAVAKGTLLTISGWDATGRVPKVTKADTSAYAYAPHCVALEAIPQNKIGKAGVLCEVDDLNTSGFSAVGDAVWAATAGGIQAVGSTHKVGRVTVKHAVSGAAYFDFLSDNSYFVAAWTLLPAVAALIQGTPTLTVGAETGGNTIAVTVQLKDCNGVALAAKHMVTAWLSDAAGDALVATAPSGGVTATTGVLVQVLTASKAWEAVSDATGVLVLSIVEAGVKTCYLNVEYQGKVYTSGAITFA